MKTLFRALVAASLITGAGVASAASTGTTFNVTANIAASCTVVSAANVAFGAYDPTSGSDVDVSANFVHRCTKGTSYTITLSAGGGTYASRSMASAGVNTDVLTYQLYRDAGYTQVFGDGTASTFTVTGSGSGINGAGNNLTTAIYGRLTSGQDVSADSYSDTITVTVTY